MAQKKQPKFATREALQELMARRSFLKVEQIAIPEWDGLTIGIRQLSVGERLEMAPKLQGLESDSQATSNGLQEATFDILIQCLVDENGKPLFEDSAFLKAQSDEVFERLLRKTFEVNGISTEGLEALKKKEDQSETSPSS